MGGGCWWLTLILLGKLRLRLRPSRFRHLTHIAGLSAKGTNYAPNTAPHPGGSRVRGHVDMHQLAPTISDEHRHIEHLEREGRHRRTWPLSMLKAGLGPARASHSFSECRAP